ncbi:unnamed protein product [Ilex paraguariensis]|uniref:Uncharacterized protein n=1 Tax=Ilex paraguariensis TaxID=185542 RepID=A0ABC8SZT4_9AQUA
MLVGESLNVTASPHRRKGSSHTRSKDSLQSRIVVVIASEADHQTKCVGVDFDRIFRDDFEAGFGSMDGMLLGNLSLEVEEGGCDSLINDVYGDIVIIFTDNKMTVLHQKFEILFSELGCGNVLASSGDVLFSRGGSVDDGIKGGNGVVLRGTNYFGEGMVWAKIKSYYGVSRNLLIKFKDDTIDETSALAQVLSSDSAISSMLDMSIRLLPGDHGLPLQQALPEVPPAMADAVNRGGELLANLAAGTPWETIAKEVGNTLGIDSRILRAEISRDIDLLVDVVTSWMASNTGPKLLRP